MSRATRTAARTAKNTQHVIGAAALAALKNGENLSAEYKEVDATAPAEHQPGKLAKHGRDGTKVELPVPAHVTLRTQLAESEKTNYGVKRRYAQALCDHFKGFTIEWPTVTKGMISKNEEAKAVWNEREALLALLPKEHSNPRKVWSDVCKYGDLILHPEKARAKTDTEGEAGEAGEGGDTGKAPDSAEATLKKATTMLRSLHAYIGKCEEADPKLTKVLKAVEGALKAAGVDPATL